MGEPKGNVARQTSVSSAVLKQVIESFCEKAARWLLLRQLPERGMELEVYISNIR